MNIFIKYLILNIALIPGHITGFLFMIFFMALTAGAGMMDVLVYGAIFNIGNLLTFVYYYWKNKGKKQKENLICFIISSFVTIGFYVFIGSAHIS